MKILLVGGGSGGSVSPLLAVAQTIQKTHAKSSFLFVGSNSGPEKVMAENIDIPFVAISAGKFRRYFSLANLASPFLTLIGFYQSFKILKSFRPNCVFGSGSFVQVPLVWAAWFLRIPVVLHQQDLIPSLANSLCQIPAKKITVTFEDSLTDFSSGLGIFYTKKKTDKVVLTGNPFNEQLKHASKQEAVKIFGLKNNLPTLLVLGGGTGSLFLNNLIAQGLAELTKTVQIIHVTGKHKGSKSKNENYHAYEFLNNMGQAYAAADIVLSRAGLSTITELSNLKKISIIVPMPNSHQEINAFLLMRLNAALVAGQEQLSAPILLRIIRKLLFDSEVQGQLQKNIAEIMPKNAAKKIADIIIKVIETT